jgi:hypothetical protein
MLDLLKNIAIVCGAFFLLAILLTFGLFVMICLAAAASGFAIYILIRQRFVDHETMDWSGKPNADVMIIQTAYEHVDDGKNHQS